MRKKNETIIETARFNASPILPWNFPRIMSMLKWAFLFIPKAVDKNISHIKR
jgi:hypothetical protein